MKIVLDITHPEDILWLESMPKERRNDTVRNCITIGRLALENYQVHIDGSKNLGPIIQKFRDEMTTAVEKTLQTVVESVQSIQQTKDELISMSTGIHQQLAINTNTMIESVKSQQNITEKIIQPITSRIDKMNEEVEKLKKQNSEYKKALILFKDKLNEVAVFNANLAYATRLFTEHSTTKQEKMNILKRFDSVSTLNESKGLYNTIKTELGVKTTVTESVVEKISNTPSSSTSTEVLAEAKAYENPQFRRMKDLMGKIK